MESAELKIETPYVSYGAKHWNNVQQDEDKGIPWLGLHGWLDNAATFDFLAPLLWPLNLTAMDFPGHGHSDHRPPGVKYHYLDYVADVIHVADALKWPRFNLIGHSLGAGVAAVTAGTFPDRVARLVLLEGIAPISGEPQKSAEYLARSITQMKQAGLRNPPVYKKKADLISARTGAGNIKKRSAEALVARGAIELKGGVTLRSDPRLRVASPGYLTEGQVFSFLDGIEAQTLMIIAEQGLFSDKQYLESLAGRIKTLKKIEIPGEHHVHMDAPERVAPHILSFL